MVAMNDYVPMSDAMQTARHENNFDTIRRLLEQGEDPYAEGEYSGSMLTVAARNNWIEIVEFMLDRGADINHQDSDGSFPLIEAVAAECREMVALLIKRGANVNLVDGGNTALIVAEMVRDRVIIEALRTEGAKDILLTPEGRHWEQEEAEKRERQLALAREVFASHEINKSTKEAWAGAWATDVGWGVWVYHADGTIVNCSEYGAAVDGHINDPDDGTLIQTSHGQAFTYPRWQVSGDGQHLSLYLDGDDTVITMTRL